MQALGCSFVEALDCSFGESLGRLFEASLCWLLDAGLGGFCVMHLFGFSPCSCGTMLEPWFNMNLHKAECKLAQ